MDGPTLSRTDGQTLVEQVMDDLDHLSDARNIEDVFAADEEARAIAEGWTEPGGKLPVNVSGGLKSKGHPIGATGVSMHAISAMQLCGEAGDMQLDGPEMGGIFNMGGAAVANYVSVLSALK